MDELNPVRVGVRRWAGDQQADDEHPASAELQQHWVQVGDVRLTAEDHQLLDVSYGVSEPGGIGVVTIRLQPSSFATVPLDG